MSIKLICRHQNCYDNPVTDGFCIIKIFLVDDQYYLYYDFGTGIVDSIGDVIRASELQFTLTPENAQMIFWHLFPGLYYHFGVENILDLKEKYTRMADMLEMVCIDDILFGLCPDLSFSTVQCKKINPEFEKICETIIPEFDIKDNPEVE